MNGRLSPGKALPQGAVVALVTSVVLAFAANGCATASGFDRQPELLIRQVEVINDNRADVVVHAVVGPQRFRLGMVNAKLSDSFEIPEVANLAAHDVIILLQAIGVGETFELGPVAPIGGSQIAVLIAPNLDSSSIAVR